MGINENLALDITINGITDILDFINKIVETDYVNSDTTTLTLEDALPAVKALLNMGHLTTEITGHKDVEDILTDLFGDMYNNSTLNAVANIISTFIIADDLNLIDYNN
ncbi:hypothetical protein [Clostridium felsineum]|uniref:hypothetical protein n=1 Tax=Clostridium felsineum TaxID=36839 RepID=UPI00098CD9B6|nr:hypothetical protein [Clostridium felsineum]URZ16913.1 hypothetical protein CLFE_029600 [Clostridium felsineum DSM 794]